MNPINSFFLSSAVNGFHLRPGGCESVERQRPGEVGRLVESWLWEKSWRNVAEMLWRNWNSHIFSQFVHDMVMKIAFIFKG